MLRAFYSSATGMKAQETLLDVTANNLANVNTNGFKRSHVDFADLLYTTVRQAGGQVSGSQTTPVPLQIGSGSRAVATTKLFTPGSLEQTGNTTDISIKGEGFFQIQLPNGDLRYTRDGAFRIDATGNLVTTEGFLLQPSINIPQGTDATTIGIAGNGNITATVNGTSQQLGNLQIVRFSNPAGLSSEGGNLFAETPASGTAQLGEPGADGRGFLQGGFLERSNVEVVTELVSLIMAQRAYEVNSRAIRAGDEMLSNTSQIVR